MTPELFDYIIADTRRAHGFSNEYRALNEHACIYRHIPGAKDRRFMRTDHSMIEALIEVIVAADRAGLELDAIINLTYHVIAQYKATNIYFSESAAPIVADYCAHVILNPGFFKKDGRAIYRDLDKIKSEKKSHARIAKKLLGATKFEFQSQEWCTPAAKEALKFIAFIGAESEDIPSLINDLKARIPFLTEILGPFELAAYLHQEIIDIHPYVDGNGRVARALMNAVLVNAGYAAIDIKKTAELEVEYDRAVDRMNYRQFAQWLKTNYFKVSSGNLVAVKERSQVKALEPRSRGFFFELSSINFDEPLTPFAHS